MFVLKKMVFGIKRVLIFFKENYARFMVMDLKIIIFLRIFVLAEFLLIIWIKWTNHSLSAVGVKFDFCQDHSFNVRATTMFFLQIWFL